MQETSPHLPRPLPALNEMNAYFWRSGADGRLRILRCEACGHWIHPYQAVCNVCLTPDPKPQAVSGRGKILSFTINHQPWFPAIPTPYVIALVELDDAPNVRLVTNLVNVSPQDTRADMPVKVLFEQYGDIFVPLFEPVGVERR